MKKNLDKVKLSSQYKQLSDKYQKLGLNIHSALELLLRENNIPYLSINYRIKDSDSFIGKIERKKYKSPFDEIEDICGLRIICYYQSDVLRIKEVIEKEFAVIENENKEENLEFDQFGYRSMHFIVKIKDNWLQAPNYRGLDSLKAEIQVRTILMHAWAEIEHKLAYKSKTQIPKDFRRKLSRISAKLEESDEQFEDLKNQIDKNISSLLEKAIETESFDHKTDFNLDTLQAFLNFAFPDRDKSIESTRELFEEMANNKIPFRSLIEGFKISREILRNVEMEGAEMFGDKEDFYWAQVGAARTVLELTDDAYFNERLENPDSEIIKRHRKKLHTTMAKKS